MKSYSMQAGLLALMVACCAATSVNAQSKAAEATPKEPYGVEIWADVRFDNEGQPQEIKIVDEAQYSPKLVQGVKGRLAKSRIPPPNLDGKPAVFESGVKVELWITPNASGGNVAIRKLSIEALPLKRYAASKPKEIEQTGGWKGSVAASCTIGRDGVCQTIKVDSPPGTPESVRRFAKASLEGWVFAPQKVNGQPIESDVTVSFSLETLDDRPDDFRTDKFNRLTQTR